MTKLLSRLDTSSDRAAERVIALLCRRGPAAVPALLVAAEDESRPRVRKWSLEALGAIGDRRAAPVLRRALLHERMTVRLHAVRALGRMRSRESARHIARLLRDPSGGVRTNALLTLSRLGVRTPPIAAAVRRCLNDREWYVRQQAGAACGALCVRAAKAKLTALVRTDPRPAVRKAAAQALRDLC